MAGTKYAACGAANHLDGAQLSFFSAILFFSSVSLAFFSFFARSKLAARPHELQGRHPPPPPSPSSQFPLRPEYHLAGFLTLRSSSIAAGVSTETCALHRRRASSSLGIKVHAHALPFFAGRSVWCARRNWRIAGHARLCDKGRLSDRSLRRMCCRPSSHPLAPISRRSSRLPFWSSCRRCRSTLRRVRRLRRV